MAEASGADLGESSVTSVFDRYYERFWRGDRSPEEEAGEIETIRKLGRLRPGASVLDLACAFGRIGNALAAQGLRVTGVDLSPALLAIARAESPAGVPPPEYLEADIRRLPFVAEFDAALLWSTALGYTDEADDEFIVAGALAALKPGGRLLVETRHWDAMSRAFEPVTVRTRGEDTLIEYHSYDSETGQQVTRQCLLVDVGKTEREYRLRRYGFPELRRLCERAGFISVTGHDESGGRLQVDSRRCVVVAVKAASRQTR
jgi:SAM-dependent methyltransferase